MGSGGSLERDPLTGRPLAPRGWRIARGFVLAVRMIGVALLVTGIAMQLSGSANAKALYVAAAVVLAYAQFRAIFLRQTQRRFERIIAAHDRDEANGNERA